MFEKYINASHLYQNLDVLVTYNEPVLWASDVNFV
jgi:hypothetical protein